MKPSLRIKEIEDDLWEKCFSLNPNELHIKISAVIEHLDEEYERKQNDGWKEIK